MWRKGIIFIALFLLWIYPSAYGIPRTRDSRSDDKAFRNIETLFLLGNYQAALQEIEKFSRENSRSRHKREAIYIRGLCYLKKGDYKNAEGIFDDLRQDTGGDIREKAYLGLGESYYSSGNYEKAVLVYKEFLNKFPKSEFKSTAYHKLAACYNKLSNPAEAGIYLNKLNSEYGKSVEKVLPEAKAPPALPLPKAPQVLDDYTAPVETSLYSVQVGYFSSLKNAKRLHQKLIGQNYTAFLEKHTKDGRTFYRVKIGQFGSRREAGEFARKLKKRGYQTKVYP